MKKENAARGGRFGEIRKHNLDCQYEKEGVFGGTACHQQQIKGMRWLWVSQTRLGVRERQRMYGM